VAAEGQLSSSTPEGWAARLAILRSAPRELWLVLLASFLGTVAYALVHMSLHLYVIEDLSFSREQAGTFLTAWAAAIAVASILIGCLVDALGVRRALLLSFGLCAVTRALSAFLQHPWLAPVVAFLPMAFGVAMAAPVMVAALRRYASPLQRPMAFALYYLVPQLGFVVAGRGFDWIRKLMAHQRVAADQGGASILSVWESCFLVAAGVTLVALVPMALWLRQGAEMSEQGLRLDAPPDGATPPTRRSRSAVASILIAAGTIMLDALRRSSAYRLLLLVALLAGMRGCFTLLAATDGLANAISADSRDDTGLWWVLSALPVAACLLAAVAVRASSLRTVALGASLCAASAFLLVLPSASSPWLGRLGFACGEAIIIPRVLQYVAEVAPKGRVATYASLSSMPGLLIGTAATQLADPTVVVVGGSNVHWTWLLAIGTVACGPVALWGLRRVIDPR
jgi:MFS family permease